jgi:transposase
MNSAHRLFSNQETTMRAIQNNNEEEIQRLREALARSESERESFIVEREAFVTERASLIAKTVALTGELRTTRIERDLLKEQLALAIRRVFAAKSEARGSEQKDLFFNEAESLAPVAAKEAEACDEQSIEVPAHRRARRGRKPLDPALPREVIRHEIAESERRCPVDGNVLVEIGVEASEQLDIVPAQIKVLRHERVKYACPCCDQSIRLAPAPAKLIPKGLLADSALAWVIQAKYQDSLPLYRQAAILNRFGGDLSRNTLAAAVVRVGQAVQPVVNLMRDQLLECELILGDETELQVLKEPGRAAQSKSYLWAQMSGVGRDTGPPIRLFTYAASRSGETARELYAGARGALLTDGYDAYESVAKTYGLTHLGCWAHARRRFVEAEAALPKAARSPEQPATKFIAAIAELYAVEAKAREVSVEERTRLRKEHSAPVLDRIEKLFIEHRDTVVPQSALGKALHYLGAEWPKLVRFAKDGRFPIDNNACENAIRPFVVGRRNWLFADTVGGANASANLYSLIETAKANGVDPYRYLCALFAALPRATRLEDYEALMPWRFGRAAA